MNTTLARMATDILFIESNWQESVLLKEALTSSGNGLSQALHVAVGAAEATAFLRKEGRYASVPRPGLIVFNLDLDDVDAQQVLAAIQRDEQLRNIPVIVLADHHTGARLGDSYLAKPVSFLKFVELAHAIQRFWRRVREPAKEAAATG